MNKNEIAEFVSISNHLFVEKSRFTEGLGLSVASMNEKDASMKFSTSDDLAGSENTSNLHGGVIASVMDITGSLVVFSNLVHRMKAGTLQERVERVTRINTIDLRVDYIRPGAGTSFVATGYIMRTGTTVAVSRIEMRNDEDILVAVGTASYILSVKK